MWTREEFLERTAGGVIGMVHLRALPGSPQYEGDLAAVTTAALNDAVALQTAGLGAIMVENFHDVPFHPGSVPAETVAAMTAVMGAVVSEFPELALGVNVLRNDVAGALAIAAAVGGSFVRVNVHTGATVTDQGTLAGEAWRTLRLRRNLGVEHVGIFADVRVKHARPLVFRPLVEEAADQRLRALADALIITGVATGAEADPAEIRELREALPGCPLLVGSGLKTETAPQFARVADGGIIGSSLKIADPDTGHPVVSVDKTVAFLQAWQREKGQR